MGILSRLTPLALVVALGLAACTSGGTTLPESSVSGFSPDRVSAAAELSIVGSNFFQIAGGRGVSVEVCGVTVPANVMSPESRTILLPPGGRVLVEVGERLTVTLPAEGIEGGISDLRIVRPDGSEAVVEDAVTCVGDSSVTEPLPAKASFDTTVRAGSVPLLVEFDASASTGTGELQFDWDFGDGSGGEGQTTEHTFSEVGEYEVTLTLTDENGESDSASETITVTNAAPVARVAVAEHVVDGSEHFLQYSAADSSDADGHELTFDWTATGDLVETGSDGSTLYVRANENSFHTIALTVTDPYGESDTFAMNTVVDEAESWTAGPDDPEVTFDVIRMSWYELGEYVNLELASLDPHSLLAEGQDLYCGGGTGGPLEPEDVDGATPLVSGFIVAVPSESPSGEWDPGDLAAATLLLLDRRDSQGFPLYDAMSDSDICESDDSLLGRAAASVDGAVSSFRIPAEHLGEHVIFIGLLATEDGGYVEGVGPIVAGPTPE